MPSEPARKQNVPPLRKLAVPLSGPADLAEEIAALKLQIDEMRIYLARMDGRMESFATKEDLQALIRESESRLRDMMDKLRAEQTKSEKGMTEKMTQSEKSLTKMITESEARTAEKIMESEARTNEKIDGLRAEQAKSEKNLIEKIASLAAAGKDSEIRLFTRLTAVVAAAATIVSIVIATVVSIVA